MTDKLKPCPFCGSKATFGEKIVEYYANGTREVIRTERTHNVICNVCFAATKYYPSKETAKKQWNRRADND